MADGVGKEQQKSLQSICYKRGSLQLLDQVPFFFSLKNCLLLFLKEIVDIYMEYVFWWMKNCWLITIIFIFLVLFSSVGRCHFSNSFKPFLQRKLPLETIYLDVRDSKDGW